MKNFSNLYIFTFAAVLVLLVAAALSFTALSLQGRQQRNREIETKRSILTSLGVTSTVDDAETLFAKYVKGSLVVNPAGETVSEEAMTAQDVKEQVGRGADRKLPLYKAEIDGQPYTVIPVAGKGLWGAIWGYVALQGDCSTIKGVFFDHASETPGLGAEITTDKFRAPFTGKRIYEGSRLVSVKVAKRGTYTPDDHTVDAISGGTMTSKGLDAMLKDCLTPYDNYFKKQQT